MGFSFGDFTIGGLWHNDGTQHGNFFADDITIIVGKCLFTSSFDYKDSVYISDYIKYYLFNGIKLEK